MWLVIPRETKENKLIPWKDYSNHYTVFYWWNITVAKYDDKIRRSNTMWRNDNMATTTETIKTDAECFWKNCFHLNTFKVSVRSRDKRRWAQKFGILAVLAVELHVQTWDFEKRR